VSCFSQYADASASFAGLENKMVTFCSSREMAIASTLTLWAYLINAQENRSNIRQVISKHTVWSRPQRIAQT
jgi:hypothetical protein